MNIKRSKSKAFGASLSSAERKALDKEVKRQLAEYDRKNTLEIDAMVLWVLHEKFGFGRKRLRRFFDEFSDTMDHLIEWYEMDISDQSWLCTHKLKEIGIDVERWNMERQ